jgi:hypothetical protein
MDTKTPGHALHIRSTFIPSRRADCEDVFMTLKKSVVLLREDLTSADDDDRNIVSAGAPCYWARLPELPELAASPSPKNHRRLIGQATRVRSGE